VVAVARGSGSGNALMLNAHMDTVGVAGMSDPFQGRLADGRLYGRGAQDMKGSLAACMLAVAGARERRFRGDVVLTAVSDEEVASVGTEAIAATVRADAAIVTAVRRCAAAVTGTEADVVGVSFWADSALLSSAGIPTVLFGPGGDGLHTEVEWVDVASLEQCVEIYSAVAAEVCG
jgi:acetylornithine deacetylase/succinyl-diaminopimelate desuccinylase-like protein